MHQSLQLESDHIVDEEDAFESDFASTEEEENPDEEAGERALEEEERLAKRVGVNSKQAYLICLISFFKGGTTKGVEDTQCTQTRSI